MNASANVPYAGENEMLPSRFHAAAQFVAGSVACWMFRARIIGMIAKILMFGERNGPVPRHDIELQHFRKLKPFDNRWMQHRVSIR